MERIRSIIGTWGIVVIASYIGARIVMYDISLTGRQWQTIITDVAVVALIALVAGLIEHFRKAIVDLTQDE